ncbi:hypothetical protein M5689_007143 [Euphorbia peplus]|nr:hypothetical protein M5689_007143 [Euphorbia peplus]
MPKPINQKIHLEHMLWKISPPVESPSPPETAEPHLEHLSQNRRQLHHHRKGKRIAEREKDERSEGEGEKQKEIGC